MGEARVTDELAISLRDEHMAKLNIIVDKWNFASLDRYTYATELLEKAIEDAYNEFVVAAC